MREIRLDGGEITMLKALGLSGTPTFGKQLLSHVSGMEDAELLDTLNGLIALGYVLSSKVTLENKADIERGVFRVNPSYSRELRDAVQPGRRRDEERTRRRRRA